MKKKCEEKIHMQARRESCIEMVIRDVYQPVGLRVTMQPKTEAESEEYQACRLELNGSNVVFRVGKITPERPGNFVTVWKRPDKEIVPLDENDGIDFVVVDVSGDSRRGQFVFNSNILREKEVFSSSIAKGKLGFRVFPPWAMPAPSARRTQKWQLDYFIDYTEVENWGSADRERLVALFSVM
jgi:hypothetical protein